MMKKKKMYGGAKKTMGPGGKAKKGVKRANKVRGKSLKKMSDAKALFTKGEKNVASPSAMAKDFGRDQLVRSERMGKNAVKKGERAGRIAKRNNLTFSERDGLYMKAGGSYKKAKMSDVAKYAAGGKKVNPGAVKMAKGIIKKAGMKVVSAAYGKKVIRKKK
tara:strand:+ start:4976 stop:5461 length:486 start_codon:yes stop_codon:yes gene_type:complete